MMATKGRSGSVRTLPRKLSSFSISRPAADLRDEVGDALGGGVGAVRAAEGVVDVDVAERGELLGEGGVVGFFFRVEAEVLQQQRLAGFELLDISSAISPTQSGEKATFSETLRTCSSRLAQAGDQRAQAHGLDRLALGAAEVRAEDDLGLVAQRVLDGGKGLADAGVVGDDAVLEGDVEVDADEHALVGKIQITNR